MPAPPPTATKLPTKPVALGKELSNVGVVIIKPIIPATTKIKPITLGIKSKSIIIFSILYFVLSIYNEPKLNTEKNSTDVPLIVQNQMKSEGTSLRERFEELRGMDAYEWLYTIAVVFLFAGWFSTMVWMERLFFR